jgi:glycosyltransferase involved in cell wall biosynthesis
MADKTGHYRLLIVEPSKVLAQHSTMFTGWIDACLNKFQNPSTNIEIYAHRTKAVELSVKAASSIPFHNIPVVNGDSRRLIWKTLVEIYVIACRLFRLRKEEILLIMCLMPTTLIFLEVMKRLFPTKHVVVCLHGELEGALDSSRQSITSFGFYVLLWLRIRKLNSTLSLAVLDRSISCSMIKLWPSKINPDFLHVIEHPILHWPATDGGIRDKPRACFVGYNTPNKGYREFEYLASQTSEIDFVAIGGGRIVDLKSGSQSTLKGFDGYLNSLSDCDFAIFPYTGGYSLALSAAVLDALAAGCHILATRLPFFESLAEQLGQSCVSIFEDAAEMQRVLNDPTWVNKKLNLKSEIRDAISNSPYSMDSIGEAIHSLIGNTPNKLGSNNLLFERQ